MNDRSSISNNSSPKAASGLAAMRLFSDAAFTRVGTTLALWLMLGVLVQCGCTSADPDLTPGQDIPGEERSHEQAGELMPHGSFRPTLPPVEGDVLERGVIVEASERVVQLDNAVLMKSHRGDVFVDPESGEYAWPAMVCTNPDCQAPKPNIFVHKFRTNGVDPEGNLIVPKSVSIKARIPRCPACQETDYERFEMPDVVLRKQELDLELAAVRQAHRQTGEYPPDMRSPQEIFEEISQLPKLYMFHNE